MSVCDLTRDLDLGVGDDTIIINAHLPCVFKDWLADNKSHIFTAAWPQPIDDES